MQRYFSSKKEDNFFILSENDMYHIKTVMRMRENDKVEVVFNNELYICSIDKDYNIKEIEKIDIRKNQSIYKILCIPLLQEQKMDFVLQKATELGIDEIIPIITTRSVIRLKDNMDKKLTRWQKIIKEASEQAKRLDIPKLNEIKKIDELNIDGLKIICSTKEKDNTIKKVLQKYSKCDTMVIVVGPEGGLTSEEEEKLMQKEFVPVTLGDNILRVETVPIYLLSVMNYELME